MLDFTETFYFIHDFCKGFERWWEEKLLTYGLRKRRRRSKLHLSEIITILIDYHRSGFKCFKDYYGHVMYYHRKDFTNLISYDRFVALVKRALPAIRILFDSLKGEITDILFADSTPYKVCHHKRGYYHRVFGNLACKSKSTMGWFYGLKLHFIFNKYGEIVRVLVTPANMDDRKGLKFMTKGLIAKIFADRGYLGKDFFKELFERGVEVVTGIKKNMKNMLMGLWDKVILKKRGTLETIFSSIKSCGIFEHSRHRNVENAFCHIFTALISYQLKPIKPAFLKKTETLP